ncbi:MAG: M48 family metallopeptidase [Pseudomonadota bacterium]|nr:M48 family metallopeptidase [Pseudomonadota bacterium]
MKALLHIVCALLLVCASVDLAVADTIVRDLPPGLHVPPGAQPGPEFDVERATDAWLGILSPEQRALSDAYFEGGYWLKLWSLLYSVGILAILLWTGLSRRMRDFAERVSRGPLSVAIYGALFIVVTFALNLPLSIYEEFVRQHQYGLSNLTFPSWMREALLGLAVTLVFWPVVLSMLYAIVRRTGPRWWVWATGFAFAVTLLLDLIYPVFVAPLFNDYKPLPEGPVREAVLSLARANEIPTDHLEWFDASKQTTRISANVSGLGGVARINLNDNLLEKTSLPEIRAVLGHEMGHYVLNHPFKLAVYFGLLFGIAFAAVHFALDHALARWGSALGLRHRADPAALPLVVAIFSIVWFALTPFTHTVVRSIEAEADAFGLNAAREPEGFAMAAMRLSTYRKLKPGPVEEFIFYDHPSGYDRVRRAMLWLKENRSEAAAARPNR